MERAEDRIFFFIDDVHRLGRDARFKPASLSVDESARFFVTLLFIESAVEKLLDRLLLHSRGNSGESSIEFSEYLSEVLQSELKELSFLAPVFRRSSREDLRTIASAVKRLLKAALGEVSNYDLNAYREFIRTAVSRMGELTLLAAPDADVDAAYAPRGLSEVFYRAFDAMDVMFGLNFARDLGMKNVEGTKERLYEGAGIGVQTSYATILTALYHMRLSKGAHLIDLGSGYGRLGLITGLWREDLRFTGYEYVPHRVEVAEAAAQRAGLSDRVHFLTQDLGEPSFEIPVADAYYMYDPFCAETYARVLRRIQEIGETRSLMIITKGNAGNWFTRTVTGKNWRTAESYDDGTLLIFRNQWP